MKPDRVIKYVKRYERIASKLCLHTKQKGKKEYNLVESEQSELTERPTPTFLQSAVDIF